MHESAIPPTGNALLETFRIQNPDIDLLTFEFYDSQRVAELQWEGVNKESTLEELKTSQRLLRLYPDHHVTGILRERGITSAHRVASMPESSFVSQYSNILPGGKNTALEIHRNAVSIQSKTMHLWANVGSIVASRYFKALRVNNIDTELVEFFEGLPSYQDLFGSLNYCTCEHCKSILSPAAYFVDLMRITDEYITTPNKGTIPPDLTLNARRPDLGTMELTCANTNTIIPYIQIVDEVLERRAAVELGTPEVYKALATAVYPFNLPFHLPLAEIRLYLQELSTSLAEIYTTFTAPETNGTAKGGTATTIELGVNASAEDHLYVWMQIEITGGKGAGDRRNITVYNGSTKVATVDRAWTTAPDSTSTYIISGTLSVAQASLDLSLEQYDIMVTPVTSNAGLSAYYGVDISQPNLGGLTNEDIFLHQTGLLRRELETLLYQNLDTTERSASIAHQFYINQVLPNNTYLKLDVDQSDPNFNVITNLNNATLDRINRFVRLAQHLGWNFIDLNWVLVALHQSLSGEINANAIRDIAQFKALQESLSLASDVLSGFLYDMKTIGVGNVGAAQDLFDRVYNNPLLLNGRPPYHPLYTGNPTYHDPVEQWVVDDRPDISPMFGRSRMTAALQISDNTLTEIAETFWGVGATVALDVSNLSRLYRTAKMLSLLGMTMQQYKVLLGFLNIDPRTLDRLSLRQIEQIMLLAGWMRKSGFSVDILDYVINGNLTVTVIRTPDQSAYYEFMKSLWTLETSILLTPQGFTYDTITKETSQAIFAELDAQGLIIPVLADYVTVFQKGYPGEMAIVLTEALTNPLDFLKALPLELDESQIEYVRKTLADYCLVEAQFLNQQFGAFFGIDPGIASGLMYYFAKAHQADNYLVLLLRPVLRESIVWTEITDLFKAITQMIPLALGFPLTEKELKSIANNPAAYNIANPLSLTVQNVRSLYTFKELMRGFQDRLDQFAVYLEMTPDAQCTNGAKSKALSELTGWKQEQICSALLYFGTGASLYDTVEGIALLSRCFIIANEMGMDINFFDAILQLKTLPVEGQSNPAIGSSPIPNWQMYNDVASTLKDTVDAQYDNEQWEKLGAEMDGVLYEQKRDALQPLVLWKLNQKYPGITNARHLYEFLLIDVEMSDCAQISYIKEGLNAIQLYMQRCRLDLEPGVNIMEIPEVWWEWMSNYRVWEANRKVFLYPENYLDPTLRSSKTSLFTELQNELLQNEITEETISESFMTYLDGLSVLTKLVYVDSYQCTVEYPDRGPVDTVFFFSRTETDPYVYYYCTCEFGNVWTEWKKIEQTIGSPYITPVYAFSKLFLFWVELKKLTNSVISSSGQDTQSKNTTIYHASIKYTFYNFSGEWVQPQTAVAEIVVNVTPDEYAVLLNKASDWDIFDMKNIYWNKVYAYHVTEENYGSQPEHSAKEEKITLMYGPGAKAMTLSQPKRTDYESNPAKYEFDMNVFTSSDVVTQAGNEGMIGFIPLNLSITLNNNLNPDFLMKSSERLVLKDNDGTGRPPSFMPQIDTTTTTLHIVEPSSTVGGLSNPLYGNYFGDFTPPVSAVIPPTPAQPDSFVSPIISLPQSQQAFIDLQGNYILNDDGYVDMYFSSTTDLSFLFEGLPKQKEMTAEVRNRLFFFKGSPLLLEAISQSNARTITVKNQLGWFIFNNGDEAFLARANEEHYPTVTQSMKVEGVPSSPKVYENSFVTYDIDAAGSKQAYIDLQGEGIISGTGYLDMYFNAATDLSFLFPGETPRNRQRKIREVKNILLSLPSITVMRYFVNNDNMIVQPDSFITYNITAMMSEQVFLDLQGNGILTDDDIVDPYFNAGTDLSFLFEGEPPRTKMMLTEEVRQILFQYWDAAWVVNMHDLDFRMERLTTGAINRLSRSLFTGGIDRLLALPSQQIPVVPRLPFSRLKPGVGVISPLVSDGEQVDFRGPYGMYYWEVFFQSPFLIAFTLNANQNFQQAQEWYQYIFDPTASEDFIHPDSFVTPDISVAQSQEAYNELLQRGIIDADGRVAKGFSRKTNLFFLFPGVTDQEQRQLMITEVQNVLLNHYMAVPTVRYWQFEPFRNHTLNTLIELLTNEQAIATYNNDPFNPFAIADLRIGAYEKTIVMRYIDNLLDWGDYLFTQYTWESITSATLLYVYAYDLLGNRPEDLGTCTSQPPTTFNQIREYYKDDPDGIPQFLIYLENVLPSARSGAPRISIAARPFNDINAYFCVPENEMLMEYWNRVEDRLFKIHHCMTITGVQQQLALFEPPLDPMQLVKAASANGTLDVVSQLQPVIPYYRFSYMLIKAQDITAALIQLGASLLSALEKHDAEQLSLIQATQTETLLRLTTNVKVQQIEQAQQNIASLEESKKSAEIRATFYTTLLRDGLSSSEKTNLNAMAAGLAFNIGASITRTASSIAYTIPQVGSPFAMTYGGVQIGSALAGASSVLEIGSEISNFIAQRSLTMAGYERRAQDWQLQASLAQSDILQIQKQIDGARLAKSMAEQELAVHQKSIEQAQEVGMFLKDKFTNKELYQWMTGRISTLYFQTYKIALEMALAAQSAYQYELNRDDTFVNFGYWDNLKKGLLAGEGLMLSLNQLAKAYTDNNARRLEIQKTVSLLLTRPEEVMNLRTKGKCRIELNEKMFDYDYPGHYCRQVKSVTLTIPAVVGPYQNINATLTQTSNSLVLRQSKQAVQYLIDHEPGDEPPAGLRQNWLTNQQIALSTGVEDSGMFVLEFNDERYLPFEGTGAVSTWELSMPLETNRINFESVSDVIIQLNYTALQGGAAFRQEVEGILAQNPYTGAKYLNLRQAFSSAWFAFMNDQSDPAKQTLKFPITGNILLPNLPGAKITEIYLKLDTAQDVTMPSTSQFIKLKIAGNTAQDVPFTEAYGWLRNLNLTKQQFEGEWQIEVDLATIPDKQKLLKDGFLNPEAFLNLEMIVNYEATVFSASGG